MKRQNVRLITAALAAAGIAGCFSDPTSSLRNGPARIQLTRSAAVVPVGDSVQVEARLVDAQGSILPITGASWSSDNAAVAVVQVAETQLPADGSSRAYIRGVATLGGITTVRVTARGVTDSIRVTALPTRFMGTGTFAVSGTATADTVAGSSPLVTFTAGDTLTITAPAGISFSATASVVTLGGTVTQLLARSASSLKVLAIKGYRGQATVTNVTWIGNSTTGDIAVDALNTTDTVTIARARFRGTVGLAASAFGPNTQMTLTAGPGTTFNATGTLSDVFLGISPATVLSRTASTITLVSAANYTGVVKVTNVNIGAVRVDSLISPGQSTISAAFFPGTVTNQTGRLLDTITVNGGASATFTTTPAASASQVTVSGIQAFILSRSATRITALAKVGSNTAVSVSNVIVAGTTIATLATQAPVNVSVATTGEPNEPGNNASATATVLTLAALNDSAVVYGAVNGGADDVDYYRFTAPAAGTVSVRLDFFGLGGGAANFSDLSPDFDVVVCTTLSGGGNCGYGQDIIPGNAASAVNQPELGTSTAVTAGATVYVRIYAYFATGAGAGSYRLRVKMP